MSITIRTAQRGDAPAIARIYNQAVMGTTSTFDTEPKTAADREAWLTGRAVEHPVVVACNDGEVVGWGAFLPWSDRCAYRSTVEMSVYVDDACHRQGIGATLSRHLLELAPAIGIRTVLARICSENAASLTMAARLGFTEIGTMHQVGRKFDRWLDVVMLERILARD